MIFFTPFNILVTLLGPPTCALTSLSQIGQNRVTVSSSYANVKALASGLKACSPLLMGLLMLAPTVSGPSMMNLSRLSSCNTSVSKIIKTSVISQMPALCFLNYANGMRNLEVTYKFCLWKKLSGQSSLWELVLPRLGAN